MKTVTCWSCQSEIDACDCVQANGVVYVPCCRECWGEIPVGQRMMIVQRHVDGEAQRALFEAIARAARKIKLDAADGDEWKRRGDSDDDDPFGV